MRSAALLSSACMFLLLTACGDKEDDTASGPDDTGIEDADGDGVPADEDCDDSDPSVGAPDTLYPDSDGDGFGDADQPTEACPGTAGLVDNGYDCDDTDPAMPLLVDQATGSPSGTGSSSDPIDSIATAIAAGPACIVVGPGSYSGGLLVEGDLILGSLEGAASTSIDAGGSGSVVEITAGSFAIGGFTLTGGVGSTAISDQSLGGAIQAWNADGLRVTDCVITGNSAQYGGGIFGPEEGETSVDDTSFTDNAAETTGGGFYAGQITLSGCSLEGNSASYGGGGYLTMGEGSAEDTEFSNNSATQGGGLYVADEGSFSGGSYSDNSAEKGGGVYLDEASSLADAVIDNGAAERGGGVCMETGASLSGSSISNSSATSYGGGVHADGDISLSSVRISGCSSESLGGCALLAGGSHSVRDLTCSGSNAASSGGGLYVHESQVEVSGLVLNNNTAEFGGGAALYHSQVDTRTGSATISDNVATIYGGGVHFEGNGGWWGGSFTGNSAEHGGGIFVDGLTVMEDAFFDGNSATGNGGAVLANAMWSLVDGGLTGNSAVDGGGIFVASGHSVLIQSSVITGNSASDAGGGVRVEGDLDADAVDWGTGSEDNSPQDVYAAGNDYSWDGVQSVECSGSGGCG